MKNHFSAIGLAITITAIMGVAGCTTFDDTGPTVQRSSYPSYPGDTVVSRNPSIGERTVRAENAAWPTQRGGDSNLTWTSLAFPTGDARTSVIGIERGTPKEVRTGQPFDYQIIVTNLTGNSVEDVVVSEQLNDKFKLTKAAPEPQQNSAGVVTWPVGDLQPGQSKVIRVSGTAGDEGQINACSGVTYNVALCSAIPVVSPKLRLTKTAPAEVNGCDEIAYNFEVSNPGTGSVNNVKITDTLPEGLKTAEGAGTIDIAVGTLAAGQSRKFTSRVRAEKSGVYENQARATGDGLSADSSIVSVTVHQPSLSVDIECPPDALVGRELAYRLTVKSAGDAPSPSTTLTVNLPQDFSYVTADNSGVNSSGRATWNLGTLNANDSRTVTLTLRAVNPGEVKLTASVQGACAAAATDSCSVHIQGAADIGAFITDENGVRQVGDNHVFTYVVKNQGQIALTDLTVDAQLSEGLDFVSSTAPAQPRGSGKTVGWNLGTLKPGQQVTFTITVKGTAAGEQKITAVTKAAELQRAGQSDEHVTYVNR